MNKSRINYFVISALCVALVLCAYLLFYYGRQHKVIIDNRAVELADGRNFRALAGVRVGVDMENLEAEKPPLAAPPLLSFRFWPLADQSVGAASEMMPRERIMVKVVGPSFNLKARVFDNLGETTKEVDINIELGARRDAMLRLVKLANDLPEPLEEFPNDSRPAPAPDDNEEVPTGGM